MKLIREIRSGDISVRAGIVITDGVLMLVCLPTNMNRNNWLADIPKGHLQEGEYPLQGAIRECWEETNIKFEPGKLTNPIQTTCNGDPLFLFLAKIDEIIPVNLLSCASTFIDSVDGIRKPEVEGYVWINPRTHLHLIQERLRQGIRYYFSKVLIEDCQTAGTMIGDTPPNIGSTLSLGYKNGRVLPPPKKKASSQDYSSIPRF